MAEQPDTTQSVPSNQLEGSTYEIIRSRLNQQAKELRARLDQLNDARREVFGTIVTELLSTERIATEHNCVPRDMVAIGDRFIFGYNVHLGLKTETALSDVFAVYQFQDRAFTQQPLDLIADPRFERDFKEVYRYYRHATFAKFAVLGPHLFMVFRVGVNPGDIKTFKWAIQGSRLVYQDNRSDHEFRYPAQHEFEWLRTTREWHRTGLHPHISIEDRVFVETVGGDLTVKIENNTDSGDGIYAEPVDNKDQTLDDAEIYYALVGNLILLKIRPYQEDAFRYIVYSEKIRQAMRLDSIANACVLLPDNHGIIFPDGYYLQTGVSKVFDGGLTDMLFERRLAAPNGEDFLYVFYHRDSGDYVLLRYNLISQTVETPIRCNGATFFAGGELVCFRAQAEPLRHHALQIWQTPYVGADHVVAAQTDSYLYKIGNRDLVRGMAECQEVLNLIAKEDSYANLFMDLAKLAGDVKDGYFWVDNPNCFRLGETLVEIRAAATAAIEEYEKVARVRRNTAAETERVRQHVREIVAAIRRKRFEHVNDFVSSLADLRRARGETIALGDLRYIDPATVRALEQEVIEQSDRLAHRCVQFLLQPAALQPYEQRIDEAAARIGALDRVADAKQLEADVAAGAGELEMLIDIVSNLKIDDATQRIAIIDAISAVFARVNTARAALKRKTKELVAVEGIAEFNSQLRLLNQSVASFLDVADTPEKCDESLTRLMVQIEELEGRFAESDEFVVQLTEKREDIYNAFGSRKVQLVEARNQRTAALQSAAERIMKGIRSRVDALKSINDIHGYFASDLMIEKVRSLVAQLRELGDTVKVDDIQSRLKTIREDAVRQLKDRQELFVEGDMAIRLGRHRFSVNTQSLDLTTVVRDGQMLLHLTGTNFFEPVEDATLAAARAVWDQQVVSENRDVYRAEYLAYQFLTELYRPIPEGPEAHGGGQNASDATDDQAASDAAPLPSDLTPEQLGRLRKRLDRLIKEEQDNVRYYTLCAECV
ncbi:MAG: DNA repair ATPase, partial [Patescibacteria group bacterium]|nr:DNA repair ATPase [Patescibacteria group bacterium]